MDNNAPTTKCTRFDRAITYAKNQSSYMMTYLEDSHCSISNNMSENSIRPVTVGRKNWLFCDTTDGADASMMVSLHDYLLLSLVLKCVLFETTKKGLLNSPKMYGHPFKERPSIYVCLLSPPT